MSTVQTPVCVVSENGLGVFMDKYQVSNLFLKFCREMYIGITTTKLNCYKNTNLNAILTMTICHM